MIDLIKLQQQRLQERENYDQMVTRFQNEILEMRALIHDETQAKLNLQMMADSKDSEIEQLHTRLKQLDSIVNSDLGKQLTLVAPQEDIENMRLEGYLSIPNKQNIKRHGWRKQYVVSVQQEDYILQLGS